MDRLEYGVPFFPFDVVLDEKFELIEAEFGLIGFAVVVKLYQRIYGKGYYCDWTDEIALLFEKSCGINRKREAGEGVVSEIVRAAIRRGIFDKEMYDRYHILTSAGIQKRYFTAVKRRKFVNVKKEYLLVSVAKILKNVDINEENVCKNPENVCKNEQRREEKRREKKRKENNSNIYRAIIAHLNEKAGTSYRDSNEETKRLIDGWVAKGFTEQDFYTVIDKKCDEWKKSDMEKYLRPETLFGKKFEGYLNAPVKAKLSYDSDFLDDLDLMRIRREQAK